MWLIVNKAKIKLSLLFSVYTIETLLQITRVAYTQSLNANLDAWSKINEMSIGNNNKMLTNWLYCINNEPILII